MVKIKSARNMISHLKDGDNIMLDTPSIAKHATNYFSNFFSNAAARQDFDNLSDIIPCLLTDHMNYVLTACPSMKEIKCEIFNLNKNNSPGPDGFGGIFYHT